MNLLTILSGLKYAGFVIAAFGTIVGLALKATSADGKRRKLAREERIAIWIAIISALIGILAYTVESFVAQNAALAAKVEQNRAAAERKDAEIKQLQAEQDQSKLIQESTQNQIQEMKANSEAIYLSTQPLNTLEIDVRFAGLTESQQKTMRAGQGRYARDMNGAVGRWLREQSSDEAESTKRLLSNYYVLYPFLRSIAGAPKTHSIYLVIDPTGLHLALLPIGFSAGEDGEGGLTDRQASITKTYDAVRDAGMCPESGHGTMEEMRKCLPPPIFRLPGCNRTSPKASYEGDAIDVKIVIPPGCFDQELLKDKNYSLNSSIPKQLPTIMLDYDPDEYRYEGQLYEESQGFCWDDRGSSGSTLSVHMHLRLNGNDGLTKDYAFSLGQRKPLGSGGNQQGTDQTAARL